MVIILLLVLRATYRRDSIRNNINITSTYDVICALCYGLRTDVIVYEIISI